MPRTVLEEARLHPAIRETVANLNADIVHNVARRRRRRTRCSSSAWPATRTCAGRARLLDAAGIAHHYLEFGSYFSEWRRRNALKMWTGWPTFPMVFVKGTLVGGASELERLVTGGELKRTLGE